MTPLFVDGSRAAYDALRDAAAQVVDVLAANDGHTPFPAALPAELAAGIAAIDPLPDDGVPLADVLAEVGTRVLAHGANSSNPLCAAHLHSPILLTAAVTELAIGATNQSMDSFDQAPAATYVEDHLVRRLAGMFGLPDTASGVLTPGGTASNLLGLLLARDRATSRAKLSGRLLDRGGAAAGLTGAGLPAGASRWRIAASAAAHVSIRQAAMVLGLGRDAVLPVAVDADGRMDVDALDGALRDDAHTVIAIVGTAGTTDAGAIDPLDALADRAAAHGAWLHVDAAVGSAFALSDRLHPRLAGLERADSVTADLHKLWWQPIGASALLVRDTASWDGLREPADYLNRVDDGDVLNLVDRSLDTSRRFDALKILVSLRATGRRRLGEMVEHLVDLATQAGELVRTHADLELLADPQTVTVLFRCRPLELPHAGPDTLDDINVSVQRRLLATGQAVIGRTRLHGRVALKLTFVNPLATRDDVAALLDLVTETAAKRAASEVVP
jgi:L-2,4-diaminobutyrate decarboxylase